MSLRNNNYSLPLSTFIRNFAEINKAFSKVAAGALIALQLLLVLAFVELDILYFLPVIVLGAGIFQVFMRYPRVWIYTVILGLMVLLTFASDEVSAIEVVTGVFYLGGIVIWLLWQTLVRKNKIIRNAGDWLLIFFILISSFNFVIASINNIELISWLREWHVFFLLLYYFPIREYFSNAHFKKLLYSLSCLLVGLSIFVVYRYYTAISKGIVYAYQYQASSGSTTFEAIFMAATISGIFATIFVTTGKARLLSLILTGISVGTLILTFRRTYWVVAILGIVLAIPFLKLQYQRRLVIYTSLAVVTILASAFAVIGPTGSKLFLQVAGKRFESVGKASKDLSLHARYMETQEAFQQIDEYPLSGIGIRTPIAFYEPILRHTKHNAHIHNGYVGSLLKMGYPLTIVFLIPFIYFAGIGFLNVRNSAALPPLMKVMAFGSFFILLGSFIANVTLTQFTPKASVLILAFCIAGIQIVRDYQAEKFAFINSAKSF
jgi:O-antigen ligase